MSNNVYFSDCETSFISLNILFMAPRMVYCMIYLTLEQKFVDEYDVSTCQLQVSQNQHT